MKQPIALIGIMLLVFGFSSCRLFQARHPEQWMESNIATQNQKNLFEGVVLALAKEDFRVGSGADAGGQEVVSAWRNHASPFKGRSFRERALVRYEMRKEGGFLVRVRVEREINQSIRPLVPNSAKWEDGPDQPDISKRILQYIHSYLGGEWAPVKPSED
jgi:hypothetical protein